MRSSGIREHLAQKPRLHWAGSAVPHLREGVLLRLPPSDLLFNLKCQERALNSIMQFDSHPSLVPSGAPTGTGFRSMAQTEDRPDPEPFGHSMDCFTFHTNEVGR